MKTKEELNALNEEEFEQVPGGKAQLPSIEQPLSLSLKEWHCSKCGYNYGMAISPVTTDGGYLCPSCRQRNFPVQY